MKDINILIRDDGVGYAYVYQNEDKYTATMFQDRLDLLLVDEDDIIERIHVTSKAYSSTRDTVLEAINDVLDFWFGEPLAALPDLRVYKGFKEALAANPGADFVFYIQEGGEQK